MILILILWVILISLVFELIFLCRDVKELRHDINDLTTRFISYKIISNHKIDYLLGNNNFLDNTYDESRKEK